MAERFEDLGLGPQLAEAAAAAGYEAPTPLQRAAVPVLRRGSNVVIHASAGAGVVLTYGLALLDRLSAEGGTTVEEPATGQDIEQDIRALVIVPTDHGAVRSAISLARIAQPLGLRVTALAAGWTSPEDGADVVVAGPAAALKALQASALKLEELKVLVVDGVSAILSLEDEPTLQTLIAATPRDAQRIMVSAELGPGVQSFLEGRVRRALSIPARPVAAAQPQERVGRCQYVVLSAADKLTGAARLVTGRGSTEPALVFTRTSSAAAGLAAELTLRGLETGSLDAAEGADVIATAEDDVGDDDRFGAVISYDVPFDEAQLVTRHASGGIVLIAPRELPHLRRIASAAGIELETLSLDPADTLRAEAESFRDRIRAAAREEDLSAQFQLLEPLLSELSATEVAAAAMALLRRRAPRAAPPPATAPPATPPVTWTRLFFSIGERDGIRPGDLVGAITGEAGIAGDQVGRIEIRDTFSIVEVASGSAARVMEKMNGITLKRRSLRVDYDRKPPSGGRRGPAR